MSPFSNSKEASHADSYEKFLGHLIFATRLQKILHTFALANEQN